MISPARMARGPAGLSPAAPPPMRALIVGCDSGGGSCSRVPPAAPYVPRPAHPFSCPRFFVCPNPTMHRNYAASVCYLIRDAALRAGTRPGPPPPQSVSHPSHNRCVHAPTSHVHAPLSSALTRDETWCGSLTGLLTDQPPASTPAPGPPAAPGRPRCCCRAGALYAPTLAGCLFTLGWSQVLSVFIVGLAPVDSLGPQRVESGMQ